MNLRRARFEQPTIVALLWLAACGSSPGNVAARARAQGQRIPRVQTTVALASPAASG